MAPSVCQRMHTLIVLQALIIIVVALTGQAFANGGTEPKTLDRDLEPVVIKGANVATLIGAPVEHLFVYTYTGSGWGGQIPVQADEVTASGNYTVTEDGLLDANDEIALMVKDLGDRAPDNDPLTATLTISDTWYEIEVIDPLSPTKKGWAYLVRSNTLSPSFSDDYVEYVTATERITTSQYELGFATTGVAIPFFGIHYLALNGSGVDILDRSKLRVEGSALVFGILVPFAVTEEDLETPETVLIKDGSIRALICQTANANIAGQQETIYKAYGQAVQGTTNVNFDVFGVTVSDVRTSMDIVSTAPPVTFYNVNTAGVPVDGSPDSVADIPFSTWTQISHSSGRFIQTGNPAPAGGTAKSFYRDNSSPESNDTGEAGSYGDSGFLVEGSLNSVFSIESSLFVLPPSGGGTDNVGASYAEFFSNPLIIVSRLIGGQSVYLPIIKKNN